jgi:phospholipid/cholesterol/gamma-HCH transport system substrate-binding protein
MNESPNKRIVMVGLFVSIGLMFLLGAILVVGNLHETFKSKMMLVSLFDDVNGLEAGNNVWFSGVKVGTVSSLNFYGKAQVEVCLKVDMKVKQYIRKDAKVKISTDGLIGNKILVIYGGTQIAAEVREGDTLAVAKTFSSEDMINTLQENNENLLAITDDFKAISKKIATGEGTIGKFLNDNTVYDNISAVTVSLQQTATQANHLVGSLASFGAGLQKKGTLANELVTDTIIFRSVKASVLQIQQMADTATFIVAKLKQASTNPNTTIGVLTTDEVAGNHLKKIIENLESGSKKLDEDLEALQHNFLLRGFFRKKAKAAEATKTKITKK